MLAIDPQFVYLTGSLIVLVVFLIMLALRRDLMKVGLSIAFLLLGSGPISEILFFRDYWNPSSVFEVNFFVMRILLEDLIFVFSAPVLGAITYLLLFNKTFDKEFEVTPRFLIRFSALSVILLALFFGITLVFKINSIFSITITAVLLSVFILYKRRDLVTPFILTSLISLIGTFIFYLMFILIIGPEYLEKVWLLDHSVYGINILGVVIPTTELMFAATVLPCIFSFIVFSSEAKLINKN